MSQSKTRKHELRDDEQSTSFSLLIALDLLRTFTGSFFYMFQTSESFERHQTCRSVSSVKYSQVQDCVVLRLFSICYAENK